MRHAQAAEQIREDEALARRLQLEVGLSDIRLPRYPLRSKPSFLEFHGILRPGEHFLPGPSKRRSERAGAGAARMTTTSVRRRRGGTRRWRRRRPRC